jgi:hypothetical protein
MYMMCAPPVDITLQLVTLGVEVGNKLSIPSGALGPISTFRNRQGKQGGIGYETPAHVRAAPDNKRDKISPFYCHGLKSIYLGFDSSLLCFEL